MKTRIALYISLLALILVFMIQGDTALGKNNDDNALYAPVILNQDNQIQPNAPSGALYVFFSTGTTNGNGGGRTGMNAICSSSDASAHFCTAYEIENAMVESGVYFYTPISEGGWLDRPEILGTRRTNDNGSYKESNWYANTCNGWTYDNSGQDQYIGAMLLDGARDIRTSPCNNPAKVTCCKWIP